MNTLKYNLLKYPGQAILSGFDFMIRSQEKNIPFYNKEDFPWVSKVETQWKAIQKELLNVLSEKEKIPNLKDIMLKQKQLAQAEELKSFMLYMYGYKIEKNCNKCPETDKILQQIPGMKTAMFSILKPGKHIPAHKGPFK